jgi:sulfur dioxygenase
LLTHSYFHSFCFLLDTNSSTVQIALDKHQQISKDEKQLTTNEQRLNRLKNEAENKRNAIRNLKSALQKIETNGSLDIDSRIRQAELEYALGREELQLLSIVEEARAVQNRVEKEKTKNDTVSIYSNIRNGHQMILLAFQASTGRWNASQRNDGSEGFYVDWVMDGEDLLRGDRILEINGKVINGRQKDELQKMCANTNKCDIVVIRKKSVSTINVNPQSTPTPHYNHQLQQTQADNMRLQHRISYLEEQVKELLSVQKEKSSPTMSNGSSSGSRSGTHVTSISISSSPSAGEDDDRPMVYQRGSYITTIVGGKPQDSPTKIITASVQKSSSTNNITHAIMSNNNHIHHNNNNNNNRENNEKNMTTTTTTNNKNNSRNLSQSMSRISISTDLQKQRKERERKEREKYYNNKNLIKTSST